MPTTTATSTAINAAINALAVWREAGESDNARDLEAGIARTVAVHSVIMPMFHAEEQAHTARGDKGDYKVETFHGFLRGEFRGQGAEFTYTIPELQAILDFEAHSEDAKVTFTLWVVEDARVRKAANGGKDVKVKAANFANYAEWLNTTKVRVFNTTTKKWEVVDKYTPTGKESGKAKAERLRKEAIREAEAAKILTDSSFKKLFGDLEGKNLVTAALKLQHDIDAYVASLKADYLAKGDDGKIVDDTKAKAWNDGSKAYTNAKKS